MEPTDRFIAAIKSENLLAVYAAWKEVAAGRMAPRRAELSPTRLKRATSWTFTVDVVDGGNDFRFGFAGDRMMQFLERGCEAPTISVLRGDQFFDAADGLFRRCVANRKPLVSGPYPTRYRGKEHLERQVLVLPLSEDGIAVSGLLGAFDTWKLGTNRHVWEPVLAA
jgi:hypothetical protein